MQKLYRTIQRLRHLQMPAVFRADVLQGLGDRKLRKARAMARIVVKDTGKTGGVHLPVLVRSL
jgi:hypothetical protein